jgi:hypothetical protein
MTTITWAGATSPITPTVVDGYESTRTGGNVVHPIAGRSDPDVTLAPAGLRRGTLRCVFDSATASKEAEDAHAAARAFTLTSDTATVEMYYIVDGEISRVLDASRAGWILSIPFQEIAP